MNLRKLGVARVAALAGAAVIIGANLIVPAGAHVTKRLPHLFTHLDPRYLNTGEMAADADLLDGQNSTAFLGANAKAADADLLDGQNSSAFMAGPGRVVEGAVALGPQNGVNFTVLQDDQIFRIGYLCPDPVSGNGVIRLNNRTGGDVNVFSDNGGTNPAYMQLGSGGIWDQFANASGEMYTFQIHSPTFGITTITVMSVHRAGDCHIQAQAVISQ